MDTDVDAYRRADSETAQKHLVQGNPEIPRDTQRYPEGAKGEHFKPWSLVSDTTSTLSFFFRGAGVGNVDCDVLFGCDDMMRCVS